MIPLQPECVAPFTSSMKSLIAFGSFAVMACISGVVYATVFAGEPEPAQCVALKADFQTAEAARVAAGEYFGDRMRRASAAFKAVQAAGCQP